MISPLTLVSILMFYFTSLKENFKINKNIIHRNVPKNVQLFFIRKVLVEKNFNEYNKN